MPVRIAPKIDFMKRMQRFEPEVLDSTAIVTAKQCKRLYFYRIVLGRVPKVEAQYFGFGSCYHKFREVLEKLYLAAPEIEKKSKEARDAMCLKAINASVDLWRKKKLLDPPPTDKWSFLTQARLLKSCAAAYKHWCKEKDDGRIEVLAVEQNFIVTFPDGQQTSGKADQIVRWNGKVWGRDFKTSSKNQDAYYERTLDPNDQFTRYTFAESELCGEQIQGQMIEVLFNAKSTKTEEKGPSIHAHLATRSWQQIQQWVKEQQFYHDKILGSMREADIYPMEESGNCTFCIFHSVCKSPSEASQMARLEADFKVEPWDPTQRALVDD